ncbi:MAG: LysE family transporter [Bacteroidetes bacterium]|nr:LysE family transporter [Bacteroidota bacterium]
MFHSLSIFLFTAAISFAGSIQLGPVNLAVMQAVLEGRKKAALLIGTGVCIPEFIYSSFALFASAWLLERETLLRILEWGVVPVLLAMGIFNFIKKKDRVGDDETANQKATDFLKGMTLSFLNPQLLPFWLMILVMLNGYDFFRIINTADKICFIAGTGCGEFILISFVVWITHRFRHFFLNKFKKWSLDKIFGTLFILLALVQTIKLLILKRK